MMRPNHPSSLTEIGDGIYALCRSLNPIVSKVEKTIQRMNAFLALLPRVDSGPTSCIMHRMQDDIKSWKGWTVAEFLPLAQERIKVTIQALPPPARQFVALDKAAIQGLTADPIISPFKQAAVRRQFPAQFLPRTFEEIQITARANEPGARKALKL
jgi:hypothetical protein